MRFGTEAPLLGEYQYFGRVNVALTQGDYRRLATATGFATRALTDITRQTLPTYRYLGTLPAARGSRMPTAPPAWCRC